MKVYVLGIDHEIQLADSRPNPARSEFMKLLTKIFSEHQIEFIGEETFPEKAAIARVFGGLTGIRWEAIEMSVRARQELGIQEEQAYRSEPIFEGGTPVDSKPPQRVTSDYIREEYMLWRTQTKREGASNLLVLCGFMHAEHLGKLFQREGYDVIVDSLCKYDWYSHQDCGQPKSGTI